MATVLTAYGLSEASGIVTMCRRGDPVETIAATSGRPIPGTEVRVDETGEVPVRGHNVMTGYFEDPAETARVWTRTAGSTPATWAPRTR